MQKIRPDMDIGHNISYLRQRAGLTQDQTVARLQLMGIRISKSSYAKIETNRMNIKVSAAAGGPGPVPGAGDPPLR